jgi:excisionase family DNA binding protein
LSVQHAALLLDVHVNTIYNWIQAEVLIAVHVGPRLLRIPRSEIARLRTGVVPNST